MNVENLKKLRLEKGLTQKQVCEELEKMNCYIDRTTYSKFESGKREYFHDFIIKLAIYFDTSIDYILGCTEERTPPSRSKEADDFSNKTVGRAKPRRE